MILFPSGIQGLSDTIWSGVRGAAYRLVGIDYRSEPGAIKAHQKLSKISATVVDQLCKVALPLSDGSTLWFSNESGKIWREVSDTFSLLGTLTIPGYDWRLSNNISLFGSYDYSTEIETSFDHAFSADGTKLYVQSDSNAAGPGSGSNGHIFQYTLSTAFDITTASYASKFFAGDVDAVSIFFKPDGTKFYISEDQGSTSVIEYDLSTAWDISTASASGKTYDFSTQLNRSCGLWIKPDGTEMYLSELSEDTIYRYTLSTAWDITTATFTNSFDFESISEVTLFDATYGGIFISDNGKDLIVTSASSITGVAGGKNIVKCELTTAWDITTAVYRNGYDLPTGRTHGVTFFENTDGDQSFVVGELSDGYQYSLGDQSSAVADSAVTVLGAEEFAVPDGPDGADEDLLDDEMTQYVYFATENWLLRVTVADILNIASLNENGYLTEFLNGDDTYHPMKIANNRLFIGDKYNLTEVNEAGVITLESNLSVREPERITILKNFDVDLLVGTVRLDQKSRILRWDTESDSWYGEDVIYEDEIHAFLDEDNYTYAIVGDFGQTFYYDGEKLIKPKRIPGSYSSAAKCKVNANAVGYFMGVPIFGLSNVTGNPNLQGVYSLGQYDKDYNITMDLSFPISSGEFTGMEIGAIVVQGTDVYVAWKSGTTVGVDKLDWTTKYYGGYIETMVLNGAEDRSKFKALDNVLADYIEMPASTAVVMAYSKNYASYINLDQVDDTKLIQLRAKATIPEIGAIQLKFTFNTNSNDSPKIENFHGNFQGED